MVIISSQYLPVKSTDFLVIGSGVAGLRAAIELSRHGKVLVLTKDEATAGSTGFAQGGIAVVLSDEDEITFHFDDTIRAGAGLCDEEAVRVLVEEGPERILELISWGTEFDREGTKLAFTQEAAHSKRRIVHAQGDSTGKEVERSLLFYVRTLKDVQKLDFHYTIDLIIQDGVCLGVYLLDEEGKKISAVTAKATILATGGSGFLYQQTSNPPVSTGDGMAMAYRAGADLVDMEFVQFHPTTLYLPGAPFFLLSEAMRGEGARLLNIYGQEFTHKYHPEKDLAPRDIVSRAIVSEMVETHSLHVYLDLTHLNPDFIRKRFPRICSTCLSYGIDVTRHRIPVSPAAHYMMGGIRTDLNGATNIPGLYAAGEAACTGVHGANRLASNSLLEGVVFGARAGSAAAHYSRKIKKLPERVLNPFLEKPVAGEDQIAEVDEVRGILRKLLWDRVGIIRCGKSLSEAMAMLQEWKPFMERIYRHRKGLELQNMITVATLITQAALMRKESVGAHYRTDCPHKSETGPRHIVLRKS
ncbi:MAG: L-aspartate oxidase [Nitrospirae bacterium CG_4_9_14_3_um_filter_53_35]|nr:MAG: L-aspartate oxidase [Nitrospirae bacterium CG2_30_53_67]PIS37159.1 MAG: L-aspartate oxidase [Nitrospirae bacterium CG08_land_8_20_14_0_20_52_24]PIV83405.1 MAG: L-aspartate oxidase [Nitrospirae bacterium CG17_big_fil_post_rev_8_21_14_2_50_50_9]PIX84978.1 MAG: L-aspartate oxidase [Nitrospirae bacterium CG_4_10_14_3_um_filter_53_41]PJA75383.1 MAG: L-aspartate oxidase [Nitrospirae bacterium CG_4_9_14_3_um_filter_53_35]